VALTRVYMKSHHHHDADGDIVPEQAAGTDSHSFSIPNGKVFSHYVIDEESLLFGEVKVTSAPSRGAMSNDGQIRTAWNYSFLGHADYRLRAYVRDRGDGFPSAKIDFGSPSWDVKARSLIDQKYPVDLVFFGQEAAKLRQALGLGHRATKEPVTITLIICATVAAVAGLATVAAVLLYAINKDCDADADEHGELEPGDDATSGGISFKIRCKNERSDHKNRTTEPSEEAKKFALCIGINDYPGTSNDLSGCVNDANDWKKELASRGFAVQSLLNSGATKEAMSTSIRDLIGEARRGDLVVIAYSGHGSWVPDEDNDEGDGRDEVLCPYDIGTEGGGPLTDDELYELFEQREPGVRIVMISDSCHSGSVTKSMDKGKRASSRFLAPETFLSAGTLAKARKVEHLRSGRGPRSNGGVLLAGCRDTEVSYDAVFDGRPNGAFTFYALKALKDLEPDDTYAVWHKEIKDALPNINYPQHPTKTGTASALRWKVFA
jgi:hypothetical protein